LHWIWKYKTTRKARIKCYKRIPHSPAITPYFVTYEFLENLIRNQFPGCSEVQARSYDPRISDEYERYRARK
jgi:hypothetical protein